MNDKQNVAYHTMEYYPAIKKERNTDIYHGIDESWKYYANWKTLNQKTTCYTISYIKCIEQTLVAQGWEDWRQMESDC